MLQPNSGVDASANNSGNSPSASPRSHSSGGGSDQIVITSTSSKSNGPIVYDTSVPYAADELVPKKKKHSTLKLKDTLQGLINPKKKEKEKIVLEKNKKHKSTADDDIKYAMAQSGTQSIARQLQIIHMDEISDKMKKGSNDNCLKEGWLLKESITLEYIWRKVWARLSNTSITLYSSNEEVCL